MEEMRALLRNNLARSLQAMREVDRLAAAWPVVCGSAMAMHAEVTGYTGGLVSVEVAGDEDTASPWMSQMLAMQRQIAAELSRVAGVPVTGLHFERRTNRGRR